MKLPRLELPEDRSIYMHAVIGGAICFGVSLLSLEAAQSLLEQSLIFFGSIGVMIFQQEFALARGIILFGVIYLPAGFLGGLYTGNQTEESLEIVLAIPGIVGFALPPILGFILGQLNPSNIDLTYGVLLPFVGNVAGAYLGGYAMNWPGEEEESSQSYT